MKRLAKPLAASVSVKNRKSSGLLMWPIMETWASMAFMGLFLVRVCKVPSSHAWRMTGEKVFPFLAHDLEHRRASRLQDQEPLVLDALVQDPRVSPFLFLPSRRFLTA